MELFRIARIKYSGRLVGSGSSNRWNKKGEKVIYCSSSRSLATLEMAVNRIFKDLSSDFRVMVISIADEENLFNELRQRDLPPHWRKYTSFHELQDIGSSWFLSQSSLVLKIPSVVIPKEYNFIINTRHPDFEKHVTLVRTEEYFWDSRLI